MSEPITKGGWLSSILTLAGSSLTGTSSSKADLATTNLSDRGNISSSSEHLIEENHLDTKEKELKKLDFKKTIKHLSSGESSLGALSDIAWNGCPESYRATTWRLLLGLMPAAATDERRATTLKRKRKEYFNCIPRYYDVDDEMRTDNEQRLVVILYLILLIWLC